MMLNICWMSDLVCYIYWDWGIWWLAGDRVCE